ncbi:MAG: alpha/beta hydrolase [Sulfurimonas sp.]|uniref:alpha/beta fold hydrolase n=1 Tax=Sulfurimonas sp. TaxID=2022749 RepID=UPI0028CC0ADF|nr:alpha/beta hydrolase [Sulfurimonas sp.]MDT8339051.1 alpha/beta hydrolase [Sulfurimonas sp.]
MHTLVNGIQVFLQGDSSSQPVVFIHGFPFDHTLWDDVSEQLKDDYYCISYDIRGFGSSEVGHGQYTMESYVDDLEAVILQLDLQEVIVCGFSMGGYIALRANERLQNFKALILANTSTSSDNDEAKLKRAKAIQSIEKEGVEPFLDNFFTAAFTQNYLQENQDKIALLKEKILTFNPLGVKGGLIAMISRTDTTQSLEKTPPTLLIGGSKDTIISPKIMKDLASKIKNSHYIELQDSGHMSMLEKPKGFLKALKSFLITPM